MMYFFLVKFHQQQSHLNVSYIDIYINQDKIFQLILYIGPSFPTAKPPDTANITPNTLAIKAFKRSTCGTAIPLR